MKTKLLLLYIVMVCAFLLLSVGTAQPLNAQESAKPVLVYSGTNQPILKGDSIMIKQDSIYYLTKERMSKWVHGVPHTVLQVGGKRYPYAVLLSTIYSWVYPEALIPIHPQEFQSEEETIVASDSIIVEDSIVSEVPQDSTSVIEDSIAEETPQDSVKYYTTEVYSLEKGSYDIPVPSSMNRLAIGVRGGFASTMTNINGNGLSKGFDALLDLRYAHYWAGDKNKPMLGIMTGINIGYVQARQSATLLDKFTLATDEGDVDYEVSADKINETTHQIQLELPIMFSMVTPNGFFLNAGPKLILPVYSTYYQTIKNPNISAYLPELNGKPMTNNIVMGMLSDEQCKQRGSFGNEFKLAIALGLELGYEFKLKNGHSIDLGVYADYSVYSMYKNTGNGSLITITPPSASGKAVVDVLCLTNAYASKIGFLDAGLKLTYNIDFIK